MDIGGVRCGLVHDLAQDLVEWQFRSAKFDLSLSLAVQLPHLHRNVFDHAGSHRLGRQVELALGLEVELLPVLLGVVLAQRI